MSPLSLSQTAVVVVEVTVWICKLCSILNVIIVDKTTVETISSVSTLHIL